MDTGLVEGYIFFFEVLYVSGKKRQHVLFAVIGLFAERLVRQRADTAVALQGALADLEQHTEVLVVEHPDTFHRVRGFAGRLQESSSSSCRSSRSISFCIQLSKLFRVTISIFMSSVFLVSEAKFGKGQKRL